MGDAKFAVAVSQDGGPLQCRPASNSYPVLSSRIQEVDRELKKKEKKIELRDAARIGGRSKVGSKQWM